jgi:hypothetical protein
MTKLSREKFYKARDYIKKQARPLERRLFEFHFEGGPAEAALAILATYQNQDGGFGRGLEPDIRMDASAPVPSGMAFEILRELKVAPDHPLIRRGVQYFLDTYNSERKLWAWNLPEMVTAQVAIA